MKMNKKVMSHSVHLKSTTNPTSTSYLLFPCSLLHYSPTITITMLIHMSTWPSTTKNKLLLLL